MFINRIPRKLIFGDTQFNVLDSGVHCIAVLPDGTLASGSGSLTIRIWDVATGLVIKTFDESEASEGRLVVLPDGALATVFQEPKTANGFSFGESIKIRDQATGQTLKILSGGADEEYIDDIHSLAVLPNGKIASGSDDGLVTIWDVETGLRVKSFNAHSGRVRTLVALPDGGLACGCGDRGIIIFEL